jgi:hypothetical protein
MIGTEDGDGAVNPNAIICRVSATRASQVGYMNTFPNSPIPNRPTTPAAPIPQKSARDRHRLGCGGRSSVRRMTYRKALRTKPATHCPPRNDIHSRDKSARRANQSKVCQDPSRKIFRFHRRPNQGHNLDIPAREEGRIMIVTKRVAGSRWTRMRL